MNEFYAADLHIWHMKVANLRGCATPEEWNDLLIANWNSVVYPNDRVWVPGDITCGSMPRVWPVLDALNGEKHLITGNHDAVFAGHRDAYKWQREWLDHFASVLPWTRRRVEGQQVLTSHFPYSGDHGPERYTQYRLRDEGLTLIHGHTHSTEKVSYTPKGTLQICVSMDAWGLKPAPFGDIMRIIRDSRATPAKSHTPLMLEESGIPR